MAAYRSDAWARWGKGGRGGTGRRESLSPPDWRLAPLALREPRAVERLNGAGTAVR